MSIPSRRSGGQALTEFALVLPVILLLIMGVIDFGRAIYAYNTVSDSARQANRMAIVNQNVASVKTRAITFAPALGMTNADVDVCFKTETSAQLDCTNPGTDACPDPATIGCLAIVTARSQYRPITPIIGSIVPPITLSSTSIGPIEFACTSGCP